MPKPKDLAVQNDFDPNEISPADFLAWDDVTQPIEAGELLEKAGLNAPRIKAEDLLDLDFTIGYYRRFNSVMNERGYAYFAVIKIDTYTDLHTVVLGANTVVDFLDLCALKAPGVPVHMKIVRKSGGKYGKYYAIE